MMLSYFKKANMLAYPKHLFYAPQWIILGVNNVCNLHCKMCDVGTKNTQSNFYDHMVGTHPINMPKALIFKIIDQVHQYYPSAKLGYAFTEPSVYPFLMESLHHAKSKNIFTSLTTNALQLTKQADEFIEAGLNELSISLDGPPEIHNLIRGNKQSFEKAIAGIEKIFSNKNNKIKVSVFCAITEWNIGHLAEFLNHLKPFPLQQVGFMHTVFNTAEQAHQHNQIFGTKYLATSSNVEELNFNAYNLPQLFEEISAIKKMSLHFPVRFQPEINSLAQLQDYYHRPEIKFGKLCTDAFNHLMIKSDGTVIPAHSRCYNIKAGNIYEQTLKEIWNAEVVQNLRTDLLKAGGLFPSCTRCCSAYAG
jgi:radical SAM protein with 4Fe4S-binding SPASM domain